MSWPKPSHDSFTSPWIVLLFLTCVEAGSRLGHLISKQAVIEEPSPIIPLTALVIDADGRLTYMGEDGCRRQIIGDPALLARLQQLQEQDSNACEDDIQS